MVSYSSLCCAAIGILLFVACTSLNHEAGRASCATYQGRLTENFSSCIPSRDGRVALLLSSDGSNCAFLVQRPYGNKSIAVREANFGRTFSFGYHWMGEPEIFSDPRYVRESRGEYFFYCWGTRTRAWFTITIRFKQDLELIIGIFKANSPLIFKPAVDKKKLCNFLSKTPMWSMRCGTQRKASPGS